MNKLDVSNYVCQKPFDYIQVSDNHLEGCCWDWAQVRSSDNKSLQEAWEELKWYRQKSLESPLKVCTLKCPFLKKLQDFGETQGIFSPKSQLLSYQKVDVQNPIVVRVICDSGCNLYCKTCRDKRERSNYTVAAKKLKEIQETWGQYLENIQLLGSGDPIYSTAVREFLMNFEKNQFPKLKGIYLHTNAQLLTEKLWRKMKAVPYIKEMEVSIDAATKETYEKIRRGGKWEILMKNLEFLTKQPIEYFCCSFVVQRDNYREIEDFYKLIKPLVDQFGRRWEIGYNQVMPWGKVSEEHFKELNIFEDADVVFEIEKQLRNINDPVHIRTNINYVKDDCYSKRNKYLI